MTPDDLVPDLNLKCPGAFIHQHQHLFTMSPEPCSYCGQTAAVPPSHLSPPTPSTTEEIDSIIKQTQRVDEAISALHARRAKFLRRLNELQSSTTKLPPEILSKIFSHVSPHFNFDASKFVRLDNRSGGEVHGQIVLSAVSSYWRQVVCSTPRLWAMALIYVKRETIGSKADLLETYLKNVRGVPFSLELHIHHFAAQRASDFEPIFRAIQKGGQAFIRLSLSAPPQVWFPTLSPYLPNLEELCLRWAWDDPVDTRKHILKISHLSSTHSLRRLYLHRSIFSWGPSDQPCYNITVLHLVLLPRHTCVQLLKLCPNLIEYRYERGIPESDAASLDGLDHFTSHNMRLFQVIDSSFNDILPLLHFPELQAFSFELGDDELETADLLAFIRRLPMTCSTLEIQGDPTEATITRAIQAVPPQVQTLQLSDLGDWDITATLMQVLWYNSNLRSFNMPGLRHICMNSVSWNKLFPPGSKWDPNLFLDLLSARKDILCGRFVLEIGSHEGVDMMPFKSRLRALASEGLQLEILVSGARISGLSQIYE